ncbi:MAG: YidC/Oxa1 family membrane protein insertase [Firmicutes bacterium]|nr:YidC/Oxa1 family membrane protein insertase [Bacillota bacterium]
MAFINLLGLAQETSIPQGGWETLWSWLILGLFSFIKDYGWRVVIFTLILKLLLSPLDIYQRVAMKKNQRITESLKPEMEKLEKQYGSNPKALQQKKAELNKKEGVKQTAGCLPMLITLLISIWLLMGGLNPISQFKNTEQYLHLYDAYTLAVNNEKAGFSQEYEEKGFTMYLDIGKTSVELKERYAGIVTDVVSVTRDEDGNITDVTLRKNSELSREPDGDGQFKWLVLNDAEKSVLLPADLNDFYLFLDEYNEWEASKTAGLRDIGQKAVVKAYFDGLEIEVDGIIVKINDGKPVQEKFLWVQNIWVADTPWEKPIKSNSAFLSAVGDYGKKPKMMGFKEAEQQTEFFLAMDSYEVVTEKLQSSSKNGANGLLILPILSIIVMIGSQMLMRRLQKKSGQLNGAGGMGAMGQGKVMAYMMPVIFGIFALFFTTAFSLYMITNSLVMIMVSLAASFIMRLSDKREAAEQLSDDGIVRYGRPDPNKAKSASAPDGNSAHKEDKPKKGKS